MGEELEQNCGLMTPTGSPAGSSMMPLASAAIAPALRSEFASELDGAKGTNRAERRPTNDRPAIEAWLKAIAARSRSTNASYRKEAERSLLWCVLARRKPMSSANVDDCLAYMAFLQRIPEAWQSRRLAKRLEPGWTPFRGQLAMQLRGYAVKVVARLCAWLTDKARYLDSNPWDAVDRRLVEGDELAEVPVSKALSKTGFCLPLEGPS